MCCFGSKDTAESEIDFADARSSRSFPSYTSSEYGDSENGPPLRSDSPLRFEDYVYPFRTDPLPRFDLEGTRGFFPPLQRLRNQTFPITPPQTPPRIPTPFGTPTSSRSSSPIDLSLFPPPPGAHFH